MNKANLTRDCRGRQDPKSLVLETIPGLVKSFRPEMKKSVYWRTVERETENGSKYVTISTFGSLQEVIDAFFVDYPVLRPYASMDAIYAQIESNKNIPLSQAVGHKAYEYWECGGCQEEFWHSWDEKTCSRCGDTAKGAPHACLDDVIAAGCPIDWKAQEVWEREGCQPHVSSLGDSKCS